MSKIKITKEEFDKLYVGRKLVVNCPTEELANEFLEVADKFGYRWCTGEKYVRDNCWNEHKEDTCYHLYGGTYGGYKSPFGYYLTSCSMIKFKGFSKQPHQEYKLIVNEDKKTIVLIDSEGNKGKSNCYPEDQFDIGFGIELAKARLEKNEDEIKRLLELSNGRDSVKSANESNDVISNLELTELEISFLAKSMLLETYKSLKDNKNVIFNINFK